MDGAANGDDALLQPLQLQPTEGSGFSSSPTVRISPNNGRKKGVLLIKANLTEPEPEAGDMPWPESKAVTPMIDCWEQLRATRQQVVKQAALKAAQQQRKAAISRINQKYQAADGAEGGSIGSVQAAAAAAAKAAAATPAPKPHTTTVTGSGMRTSPIVVHMPGDPLTSPPSSVYTPGQQRRSVLSPLSPRTNNNAANAGSAENNLGDMLIRKDTLMKSHRNGKKAKGKRGERTGRKEAGVDNASAHRRRKKMVAQFEGGVTTSSKELAAREAVLNTIAQLERPAQKLQGVIRPDSKHFETVEYETLHEIKVAAAVAAATTAGERRKRKGKGASTEAGLLASGVQLRKKKPGDGPVSIRTSVYL